MPGLSRRTFLTRGSVAVAVGGVAAAVPGLGSILEDAPEEGPNVNGALTDAEAGAADLNGPLVAHVSDIRTGEINLYQGESRVVFKNPGLVANLHRTIAQQGK